MNEAKILGVSSVSLAATEDGKPVYEKWDSSLYHIHQ
jgi:hypothetical protein